MKHNNLSPEMGAILRAWWPHDDAPTVAGPKLRPVIFLGETYKNNQQHWVVAYGTTKTEEGKETRNGGDLIVLASDDGSFVLNADTRFDFNKVKEIPATAEFFKLNKVGFLPEHLFGQAAHCMKNANVAQKLARLGCKM